MTFAFYLLFCVAVAFLGRNRRIGALGFFIASVLLTPLLSLLILILTTDHRAVVESTHHGSRHA